MVPFIPLTRATPHSSTITPSRFGLAARFRLALLLTLAVAGSVFQPAASRALATASAESLQVLDVHLYLPLAARSETVPPPLPTPTPWAAEEDDPSLQRSGDWQVVSDPAASGGSYLVSNEPGSSLRFRFQGTNLAIYRSILPDGGRASLTVDGQPYGEIVFAIGQIPEARHQVPAVVDRLSESGHSAVLTVLATGTGGAKVTFDWLAVPSGLDPGDAQAAMVDRSNYYRRLAGLPLIHGHRAIHLAAQAHAEYCAENGLTHYQSPDKPGFIGQPFSDRNRYFGYGWPSSEVAAMGPGATGAVDTWINSVYHRLPFMDYRATELGAGYAGQRWGTSVIDFGNRGWAWPGERRLVAFPVANATDVPTTFSGNEMPNPLPGKSYPTGYPISLHILQPAPSSGQPSDGWQLVTASLRDASGRPVPAYVLDPTSDPNKLLRDAVFVLAERPLAPRSRYLVTLGGSDSRGVPFQLEWTFSTGSLNQLAEGLRLGLPAEWFGRP